VLTRGAAMALQQIQVGAQIWTGTISWDPDAGLPMLGGILVKGPDFRVITQIFRSFLVATSGRRQRRRITRQSLDRPGKLSVRFTGDGEDGESAADEVAFAIA
jgi:hypothetical protein